jgi:hypothetical protein
MGQDERRAGDVADFAGAGGDVLEGAPALVEQGEPAFAQAAQGPLDGCRCRRRVAEVSKGGQVSGGAVEGGQGVDAFPGVVSIVAG